MHLLLCHGYSSYEAVGLERPPPPAGAFGRDHATAAATTTSPVRTASVEYEELASASVIRSAVGAAPSAMARFSSTGMGPTEAAANAAQTD